MSEWKPIETAPKDGTRIVCAEYQDSRYPEDRRWHFWTDYWRKYRVEGEGFGAARRPTHWMPLPDPPKAD